MRRIGFCTGLLLLMLAVVPALADEVLRSAGEVVKSEEVPTDVGFDKAGRIYMLYEQEAFLDVHAPDGRRLQRRGGHAKNPQGVADYEIVSQWVGRLAHSLLLGREPNRGLLHYVFVPGKDEMELVRLNGMPDDLQGNGAIARDLDGRIFVYHEDTHRVLVFGGSTGKYQNAIRLEGDGRRVYQMAVDSKHNLYLLGREALTVFSRGGQKLYDTPGVESFYLTGSDFLGAAGEDWVRRYLPGGRLDADFPQPPEGRGKTAAALSINDKGQFFIYYRDTAAGNGVVVKLDTDGKFMADFRQPERFPPQPDPGYRLDYQGRLHIWLGENRELVKLHPGGQLERRLSFESSTDDKGYMSNPSSLCVTPDSTVWITDPGNFRLQRFNINKGGWQKPIPVGIKGGATQAQPRQVVATASNDILCVVYPPAGDGQIVLQRRDADGTLISQRDLGNASGDPIIKVAMGANGDLFIYRSRGKGGVPEMQRFTARGSLIATVGGENKNFHLPGQFTSRVALAPAESVVPYRGGCLLPNDGKILLLDETLVIKKVFELIPARGRITPIFGGAVARDGKLYVTDRANRCLHKVLLKDL